MKLSPPPPSPEEGTSRPLEMLFDNVTFGVNAEFDGFSISDLDLFADALSAAGALRRREVARSAYGAQRFSLAVPVVSADGQYLGEVSAELVLAPMDGVRMKMTSASSMRLNPLHLLRNWRGAETCGKRGLDGNTNVVGPFENLTSETFLDQLRFVRIAIDEAAEIISAALPKAAGAVSQSMHLRAVEVCRDRGERNAIAVARSLQRTMLAGSVKRTADAYRRGASDDAGVPAVRWKLKEHGPTFKVYAKRPDLLRAEVACLKRETVRAVFASGGAEPKAEVSGEDAVAQLDAFARAVKPMLDDVALHSAMAIGSATGTADLLLRLRPLFELAWGSQQGPGAPPKRESIAAAGAALTDLIEKGSFHASGTRTSSALRRVLEGLSGPSGPLHRGGSRRTVFTLRADHAEAAGHIANAGSG